MPEKQKNLKPKNKSPSQDIYLIKDLGQSIQRYLTCGIYTCGLS